jgi:hypothetical protein
MDKVLEEIPSIARRFGNLRNASIGSTGATSPPCARLHRFASS